jgi:hypothetical protein
LTHWREKVTTGFFEEKTEKDRTVRLGLATTIPFFVSLKHTTLPITSITPKLSPPIAGRPSIELS